MFDDLKTPGVIRKIMNGGTGKLSDSQLVMDVIYLPDFCKGLSKEETDKVTDLYNEYRSDKTMHEYDMMSLYKRCQEIETDFKTVLQGEQEVDTKQYNEEIEETDIHFGDEAIEEDDDVVNESVNPLFEVMDRKAVMIAEVTSDTLIAQDVHELALCILAICDEYLYKYKGTGVYDGAVYLQDSLEKRLQQPDEEFIDDILGKYEKMRVGIDSLYKDYIHKDYDRNDKLGKNIWYVAVIILALENAVPRYYKDLKKRFRADSPLECSEAIHSKGIEKNNIIQKQTAKMAKMLYQTLEEI